MKIIKALFSRLALIIIVVVLEILLIYGLLRYVGDKASWIETILHVASILVILYIINTSKHLSSDLFWIVLISLFPIPATLFYFLAGAGLVHSRTYTAIVEAGAYAKHYYNQNKNILNDMDKTAPELKGQFHYIADSAGFPFYENDSFDYYKCGEDGFGIMLEELKKAEKFIGLNI